MFKCIEEEAKHNKNSGSTEADFLFQRTRSPSLQLNPVKSVSAIITRIKKEVFT